MILLIVCTVHPAHAHHSLELKQQVGQDIVYLNVPAEGVVANQAANFTVQVVKSLGPNSGEQPEICKSIKVSITMPQMPGMPSMEPALEPMGDPGLMLFTVSFPHGGAYRITITANNGATFETSFDENVQDPISAAGGGSTNPFDLQVTSDPTTPQVGQPAALTLRVIDTSTGKTVTDFDVVHEKKMHLFVVRSDLSRFFHVHPDLHPDGSFTYSFIFPIGGDWRLFADSAPHTFGSRITSAKLTVSGQTEANVPLPAAPTVTQVSTVDDMSLTLDPGPLEAHDTRELEFILRDSKGRPVTDIQPWLGADAHLMLVDSTATLFVHSHPAGRSPAEISAGKLDFVTHMPQSGLYKGWLQLQRGGRIHTFVFLINVA